MRISATALPVSRFMFKDHNLGLFQREEKWNGLAKYVCLTGRFELEWVVVIDKEESFPSIFFTAWDNLLNETSESELVPVLGSSKLATYMDDLMKVKAKDAPKTD